MIRQPPAAAFDPTTTERPSPPGRPILNGRPRSGWAGFAVVRRRAARVATGKPCPVTQTSRFHRQDARGVWRRARGQSPHRLALSRTSGAKRPAAVGRPGGVDPPAVRCRCAGCTVLPGCWTPAEPGAEWPPPKGSSGWRRATSRQRMRSRAPRMLRHRAAMPIDRSASGYGAPYVREETA
jgi:hypothetical protein